MGPNFVFGGGVVLDFDVLPTTQGHLRIKKLYCNGVGDGEKERERSEHSIMLDFC